MSSNKDGFTAHGIDHGSNSMISDFTDAPDYFVARRLKNIPFAMGVAVDSGTAIEAGVEKILVDKCSIEEGIDEAFKVYDALVARSAYERATGTIAPTAIDTVPPSEAPTVISPVPTIGSD